MRIFVTGGTGLVGSHVIEQLAARGDAVVALSRSAQADAAMKPWGAQPLRGDLGDEAALVRGIEAADAVVHTAAIVLSSKDWSWFYSANVGPVETIARLAARAGRRLVHISSVAAYGRATTYDQGAGSVSEEFGLDRPIFRGDHYARSKREAELALWRVVDELGLSAVALRPCVIYGERDRAFATRVTRTLRRGWAPLIGTGDNPLSAVYAGNVAAAVLGALDHAQARGAYNVCNDGTVTQREFIERFAAGLGVRVKLVRVAKQVAWTAARVADGVLRALTRSAPALMLKPAVQFLSYPNPFVSDKATRELGWVPVVAAPDAVERTGRWFAGR